MILKSADDKAKRLALLQEMQRSSLLDARQKQWLREELSRLRKGIQGEKDSAHYLDAYFKDGKNHVVLHDLRFVVDGEVAQIDHMAINRGFGIYLFETKNYSGSLCINEQGEFTAEYEDGSYGVPSPIEQSKRHERILRKVLAQLGIESRVGSAHECHHVVLLHPKAIIKRPPQASFDTTNVIKADQFPTWHAKFVDKTLGFGKVLVGIANLRSMETLQEWGEKLARQHRPANLLDLPDFMRPKEDAALKATARPVAAAPSATVAKETATSIGEPAKEPTGKRLVCAHCSAKISYPEGKFCWNNATRFGGLQYCREHQALF